MRNASHRWVVWVVLGSVVPGCFIVLDDKDGDDDDDDCLVPAIASPQLRDPDTLTCVAGPPGCNPECGPCPGVPATSWGICGSPCEALDDAACVADDRCRLVRDAYCAVNGNCFFESVGCFPTDMAAQPNVLCTGADAWTCSTSSSCVAYHIGGAPSPEAPMARQFSFCGPEGKGPGKCHDAPACASPSPQCPAGTTAGVVDGCHSGACIPNDLCEPGPTP